MKKVTLLFVLVALAQCFTGLATEINPHSPTKKKVVYAPVNDDCANATTLTVNPGTACTTSTTVSFTAATSSTEPLTSCSTIDGKDIWYQFTATTNYHSIALSSFTGTAQPVIMALYSGDCGSLTQLYCSANNVINATELVAGQTYKIRLFFNLASPSLATTFSICVNTPSVSNSQDCSITTINYSFESPTITGTSPTFVNDYTVQGWRTTANDHIMEYWPSANYLTNPTITAYQGSQFIELNANANQGTMGVYQDYATPQPVVFTCKFAHRGRMGTDTIKLLAGDASQPVSTYTTVTQQSTGNGAWQFYGANGTITYTVPAGQTVTRFYFQAVSTATGDTSIGNFLDNIEFTATNIIITQNPYYMGCGEVTLDIEATGFGTWTAHADNPSVTTFSDATSQNTQVSGFSVPGTYYFDWGTNNCISTLEVTYTGPEPGEPVTTNVTYCQGQTAVPLTAVGEPGATLIWYYAGNEYDGVGPTPSTTTIGTQTYYVAQMNAAGCSSVPVPQTVTITSGFNAVTGFTLPTNACAGGNNVTPTTASGFTTGGTYTATPAGLTINPTTGEITVGTSIPGTYTVTYSVASASATCIVGGNSSAEITIDAAPALVDATPLEVCDDNYDGFDVFNLTTAGNQVANGQNLTLTYYTSLADAQAGGSNNIANPTAFTTTVANTQTVYVRAVETGNTTNCYATRAIQLIVHPKPAVPVVSNYVLCDDLATTGNVTVFDLTTKNAEATAGVSGLTVTYYTSQSDAQAGTNAIGNASSYSNTTTPQTVWVRAQNSDGCFSTGSFNLIVNPLPTVNTAVTAYRLCDDGTGHATFTLSSKTNEITNNTSGYTVTYYASQANANAGTSPLTDSYYSANATIYVRVVDNTTGCVNTTSFSIEVIASPTATAPADVFICSNDSYVLPALSEGGYFTGTGGVGPLAVGTAITATQTIYVYSQVGSGATACSAEDSFVVTVYPQPVAPEYDDVTACQSYTLGSITGAVYRTATGGAGIQLYPGDILTQTRTVYVWAQTGNGTVTCTDETSFVVTIVHPPVLTTPTALEACDDASNNGTALFDLTPAGNQAVNNQSGYTITYYTSNATAQAGGTTGQITDPTAYEGSGNVYIRVVAAGDATACQAVKAVQLIVHPKPNVLPLSDYAQCDYTTPAQDGVETFDLTTKTAE
ncbi:hypothetical protein ACLI1A_19485, partial [Flavobacterium sp. RHBU_3]|uniref:Ig-like domain-containing protein n=1 Tax=Flavobacterium sp. RHBU_3 TaxID=3391184 RepID=UPI0039849EA7